MERETVLFGIFKLHCGLYLFITTLHAIATHARIHVGLFLTSFLPAMQVISNTAAAHIHTVTCLNASKVQQRAAASTRRQY